MTSAIRRYILPVLALTFVACFEYDSVVHINEDGSGRAEMAYRVPAGLLEKTDLGDKIPLTQNAVDARYRMRAGITQYRAEFRELESMREVRIMTEFDHVSSLSERGNEYSYEVDGPWKIFRVRLDRSVAEGQVPQAPNPTRDKIMRGMLDKYKIRYKVYLPGKIDQSNAQVVDWNAATWEIPLSVFIDEGKSVIVLEARSKATMWERIKWRVSHLFG